MWPSTVTPAVCVAKTTLQPLLGQTVQFDSKTSVGPDLLSYGGHHLVGPSVVRKAHDYLQRAASVTPSLPARRPLYGSVSARRGVAVCRDAQRVVAVGQRSRERSHKVRLRTTLLPRRSSQVVKPAQAGALTTPPPESCRASSARIASRALWSAVSLAESAA